MDSAPPSFGRQLNDQLPRIQAVVQDHIGFLGDVREYLKERVALDRQYGSSLQAIVKKAMDKKLKREQAMSVGTDPSKPWSGSSSTLDAAWSRILSEADEEATDRTNLADSMQNQVCEALKAAERKKESTRKKHVDFATKLLAERDKLYNETMKTKQRYDEACSAVESTRVKQGQAKDEKHVEKAAKNMDSSTNTMMSSKNAYILALHVANEAKNRFYQVDLPSLGDDFQSLWSLTTFKLVSILKKIAGLTGSHLEAQRLHNEHFLNASTTIDAVADQRLFIEFNSRSFVDPPDFTFEPCSIWHDTSEFALSASEPKTLLQNKLVQARSKAEELEPSIEAKKNEILGLEKLREAYALNESLGDPDEVVDNLLESVRQTITLEMQHTMLQKEIEVLADTLGDDQGSRRPHNFKSAGFVTPTPCHVCKSSIWGLTKQGVTCKTCSLHAHVKCSPKVPADCPGTAAQSSVPSRNSMSAFSETVPVPNSGLSLKIRTVKQGRRASTVVRDSSGSNNGLSRSATTAGSGVSSAPRRSIPSREQRSRATMLYGHEASTPFEVSVPESAIVSVIMPDDGSGWIKVETQDRRQGLVPATYIELVDSESAGNVPPVLSPRVKQAKVVFDWSAQAPDEHSITIGETVTLTDDGENYSDGWYEIIKSGRKGIIPSNYVELL